MMKERTIIFVYKDARGQVSGRHINNIRSDDTYIQAYCIGENALRTFRKDRILETVAELNKLPERVEYFRSIYPDPPPKNSNTGSRASSVNFDDKPEVCFTGFKKDVKEELKEAADLAGMFVRDSVTKTLDYLVCGYNAGPKKIDKARDMDIFILFEEQYRQLLETGEIPDC